MKEYKMVILNGKMKWTMKGDADQMTKVINDMVAEGWNLEHSYAASWMGHVVGVFSREKNAEQ